MKENEKRTTFIVDKETLEQAKSGLDRGDLSSELRNTVERLAYGADVAEETRLADTLKTLREDRRSLRQEKSNIQSKIDEKNRKIERVEQRLDQLRDREGEYDGVLAMLEEDLSDGVRIMEGTDKVKRAASIGDCEPSDVIEDLQERNPEIPDKAFRKARPNESPKWNADQSSESLL